MHFFVRILESGTFQPHGYCYQWNAGLVWLHVISDVLIAAAYFTIPLTLVLFIRKRRDLPFSWIFALFGVFIVACGTTHVMENLESVARQLLGRRRDQSGKRDSLGRYGDPFGTIDPSSARASERRPMDGNKKQIGERDFGQAAT